MIRTLGEDHIVVSTQRPQRAWIACFAAVVASLPAHASAAPPMSLVSSLALRCLRAASPGYEIRVARIKDDASGSNERDGYGLTAAQRANGVQYMNGYAVDSIKRKAGGQWEDGFANFGVDITNGVMDFMAPERGESGLMQEATTGLCHYKVTSFNGSPHIQVVREGVYVPPAAATSVSPPQQASRLAQENAEADQRYEAWTQELAAQRQQALKDLEQLKTTNPALYEFYKHKLGSALPDQSP